MADKEKDVSTFDQAAQTPARKGGKQTSAFLRRNAAEVMHYRIAKKIILISVAIVFALLMVLYGFALIYDRTGRFTVMVKNTDKEYNITLSEKPDFPTYKSVLTNDNGDNYLSNDNKVRLDNISGANLPKNIDEIDGDHSGDNYLAFTFYCKSLHSTPCSLEYEVNFNNVTNGLDECIRVRLYVNGEKTDYAKTRSDGGGKETVFCDKSFANVGTVCYGLVNNVPANDKVKFTIVVWIEGNDVDCNDSVINGSIKLSMSITARDPE